MTILHRIEGALAQRRTIGPAEIAPPNYLFPPFLSTCEFYIFLEEEFLWNTPIIYTRTELIISLQKQHFSFYAFLF